MSLLINAARVSPPLRDAVATVEKYTNDLDREVEVLRSVVNVLNDMLPADTFIPGWMKHSPADEAFQRALGNGSDSAAGNGSNPAGDQ